MWKWIPALALSGCWTFGPSLTADDDTLAVGACTTVRLDLGRHCSPVNLVPTGGHHGQPTGFCSALGFHGTTALRGPPGLRIPGGGDRMTWRVCCRKPTEGELWLTASGPGREQRVEVWLGCE